SARPFFASLVSPHERVDQKRETWIRPRGIREAETTTAPQAEGEGSSRRECGYFDLKSRTGRCPPQRFWSGPTGRSDDFGHSINCERCQKLRKAIVIIVVFV